MNKWNGKGTRILHHTQICPSVRLCETLLLKIFSNKFKSHIHIHTYIYTYSKTFTHIHKLEFVIFFFTKPNHGFSHFFTCTQTVIYNSRLRNYLWTTLHKLRIFMTLIFFFTYTLFPFTLLIWHLILPHFYFFKYFNFHV